MVTTVSLVPAQTMLASDFKVVGNANWPPDVFTPIRGF